MRSFHRGRLVIKSVVFEIADGTGGKPAAIMLRGKDKLKNLPPVSKPIPVHRKVEAIAFLHTAAWVKSGEGTVAWEYEVRYQGFEQLTKGADTSAFIQTIPIKVGVDVHDWLGSHHLAPAYRHLPKKINVYMTFWKNPKPDIPVESILVRSREAHEVPIVLAISTGTTRRNYLAPLNPSALANLDMTVDGFKAIHKRGALPRGWAFHHWKKGGITRIVCRPDPLTHKPALCLINIKGGRMGFLYKKRVIHCRPGMKLALSFEALTPPGARGDFIYEINGKGKQTTVINTGNAIWVISCRRQICELVVPRCSTVPPHARRARSR